MTRVRSIAVAISLAMGAVVPAVTLLAPAAHAAEEKQQNKITTKAVAVPLKAAQEAMQKKQWDTALTEIKKAAAVEKKTPFEAYQIDEFMGFVLIQQKKFGEAAPVFERMLNSGLMPADQVDDRTKTVAQLYFQQKDYTKAAQWSKKWLEKHPNTEDMGILLGQSQYLLNDFKGAAETMRGVVNNAEKAGRKPDENWIQIVMSSYFKMQPQDKDGIGDALKKMVRYYPKPEYWENLLDIYRRKEGGDRISLGYYRLMNEVGVLKDKGDFVEMAQLAIDAGVPGEAQAIVQKGMDSGVLKSADKTEQGRYDRLLKSATDQANLDRKTLTQQQAEADKAGTGQVLVGLGQAYLSYGETDKAIAALEKGIAKGGVTDADEAQLSLGMAYLKKGQKEQAREAFKKAGNKFKDLGELWVIRTQSA
ncbi:tetratricopeptide repeat protein [Steroidobacter agaridevorans]|uniref:tetratricopeptide repeat protein n=1 Tax=Steroidobacter agaridevorans TaxID=2695856 RepID=UPI001379834A|nr:tetratricopeptide repeat protein [Steroidobacter agaridevorans]